MRKRLQQAAAGFAPIAFGAAPVWAQTPDRYYGYHMMGGWIFGPLMMILMIAVIVVIAVVAVRWLGGGPHPGQHPPAAKPPLEILKERFARGEIDAEEYEARRRVLEQ